MALTNILRNYVVYADGFGKVGDGSECMLPKITGKTEDYLGGGMYTGVKVELAMDPLEASFKLTSFDPQVIKLGNLYYGQEKSFTFRGSVADLSGESSGVIARMRGRIRESDPGSWVVGNKTEMTFTLDVYRYTLTHRDEELIHIDPFLLIYRVGGVNQLENDRVNLGL